MRLSEKDRAGLDALCMMLERLFPHEDIRGRFFQGFNDAAQMHILLGLGMLIDAVNATEDNTVVLQAGGCYGLYPLAIDYITDDWLTRIITVEPDPQNLKVMQRNISEIEHAHEISIVAAALGKQPASCRVIPCLGNPGASSVAPGEEIQVMTIDDIIRPDEKLGLLVLDVEGAEADALVGGRETILCDRPLIMYEHCHDERGEVMDLLGCWGYAVQAEDEYNRLMRHIGRNVTHQ